MSKIKNEDVTYISLTAKERPDKGSCPEEDGRSVNFSMKAP